MNSRQIVLDIETTGIDIESRHRIIEISCVELIDRQRTCYVYHQYINAGRTVEEGACSVHGITESFLEDKPRFEDITKDFLAFVQGSELIIHSAKWKVGFLNYELLLSGKEFGKIGDYCDRHCQLKMVSRTIRR